MPRFLLIALNGPMSGEGDEVHAADLMTINGAMSVRHFKIEGDSAEAVPKR